MSVQNWRVINGVKVDKSFAQFMAFNEFVIVFHDVDDDAEHDVAEDGMTLSHLPGPASYPWLGYRLRRCRACLVTTCACPRPLVRWRVLHLVVWDYMRGSSRPRKPGEVVHHKRGDKMDARIKMLGVGTRKAHGVVHKLHRQRFSARERFHFGGFRFRPPLPARVVPRPELIGTSITPPKKAPKGQSLQARLSGVEARLAQRHEALSLELRHRDSGRPIPAAVTEAEWRAPRTRMLGLYRPRTELSPGEAAYVLLLAKHGFDAAAAAEDAGELPELLAVLWRRPSVNLALTNWRQLRRLPLADTVLPTENSGADHGGHG